MSLSRAREAGIASRPGAGTPRQSGESKKRRRDFLRPLRGGQERFGRTPPVTARARSTGHRNCFTYSGNDPMGARDASGLRKCCKDWPKCKDVAAPEEYRREPRGRARRPNRACDKEELRDYIGGGAKFLEDLPSYVESPYACEWKDEEGYTHFAYVWTTCCIGPKGECSHKHFRCPGFFKASACIRHCVNVHEGEHGKDCDEGWNLTEEQSEKDAFREDMKCACKAWQQYGYGTLPDACKPYV